MGDNVFSAMNRVRLQGVEDFLTEAFVFVLKHLLAQAPQLGLEIVNQLSGLPSEAGFRDADAISITTQVRLESGRPDIEIREGHERLVYVEVKHDSPLGIRQLERYLTELRRVSYRHTNLVLLTRSRLSTYSTSLSRDEYHHICWYEIHNWLAHLEVNDEVGRYFVNSLLAFLEEKKMRMQRVSKNYVQGVDEFIRLTDMMEESIPEALPNPSIGKSVGWGWRGFNINGFFFGVRLRNLTLVVFENNIGNRPTYKRDLYLEDEDFFSLNGEEQFERLVEFLRLASADAPTDQ